MAGVRFADVQARPAEFLNLTSLTLEEFEVLVAPFEAAFQDHMAAWRLDGKPRTARRFTVYRTCPLSTPEDRLFFLLTYLKTYAVQVVQGRLFGMSQSKANQWIHVLLPALLAALRGLGDAPARSLTALAHRLAVSEGRTRAAGGACALPSLRTQSLARAPPLYGAFDVKRFPIQPLHFAYPYVRSKGPSLRPDHDRGSGTGVGGGQGWPAGPPPKAAPGVLEVRPPPCHAWMVGL